MSDLLSTVHRTHPTRAFETPPSAAPVDELVFRLLEPGPHVAALFGIVILVLLGSVLVLRNRLTDHEQTTHAGSPPEEEFVSDRELIRQLVGRNGGRMRQSEIVDAVDWSKAKVSRLLADLEEDDEITKLRLGRENLICLPGQEPAASKSDESGTD